MDNNTKIVINTLFELLEQTSAIPDTMLAQILWEQLDREQFAALGASLKTNNQQTI